MGEKAEEEEEEEEEERSEAREPERIACRTHKQQWAESPEFTPAGRAVVLARSFQSYHHQRAALLIETLGTHLKHGRREELDLGPTNPPVLSPIPVDWVGGWMNR
jgi:hypothetical protein